MSAHRYWRFVVNSISSGTQSIIEKIEFRYMSGLTNLSLPGNGTSSDSSHSAGSTVAQQAFDGIAGGYWSSISPVTLPIWAIWDFGAGNAQEINHVTILNASFSSGHCMTGQVEYSDDSTTWNSWITYVGSSTNAATVVAFHVASATGSLTLPIPLLSAYGGGTSNLSMPTAALQFYGGATAQLSMPKATLQAFSGGIANFVLSPVSLVAAGHNSAGEQSAELTMPMPTLDITTGANSAPTAPSPTLSTTGTVTILAIATLASPLPALVTAGTVSGTSNAALRAPIATLVGYSGAVCSVTIDGSPALAASGVTGAIANAALKCPLFELTAGATAQNHGSANLLAPSPEMGRTAQAWLTAPGAQLTAIGHAVVTATYEAYATNLKHNPRPGVEPHDEVTHYTNFPFTHVVRYQNSYYGANSTGLYLLEGTTDDVTPIPWNWKTATTDFKSPQNKTVASAYFGGRLGPAETVTLYAGDGSQENVYNYTTPRDGLAQNHRQVFGKGVKKRYYSLGLSGTGKFELDNIELDVRLTSRKI